MAENIDSEKFSPILHVFLVWLGRQLRPPQVVSLPLALFLSKWEQEAVWSDWAIYCTLGNFLKPLATIFLPNLATFLGNFCKGVQNFWAKFMDIWRLLLVTLLEVKLKPTSRLFTKMSRHALTSKSSHNSLSSAWCEKIGFSKSEFVWSKFLFWKATRVELFGADLTNFQKMLYIGFFTSLLTLFINL